MDEELENTEWTPWSEEIKKQMQQFGDLLLAQKKLLENSLAAGLGVKQLDINEIDKMLEEFEGILREFQNLDQQWDSKKPDMLALEKEVTHLYDMIDQTKIQSQDDYQKLQHFLIQMQKLRDQIRSIFGPFKIAYELIYMRYVKLEERSLAKFQLKESYEEENPHEA